MNIGILYYIKIKQYIYIYIYISTHNIYIYIHIQLGDICGFYIIVRSSIRCVHVCTYS